MPDRLTSSSRIESSFNIDVIIKRTHSGESAALHRPGIRHESNPPSDKKILLHVDEEDKGFRVFDVFQL
jgi:hypothetical protein